MLALRRLTFLPLLSHASRSLAGFAYNHTSQPLAVDHLDQLRQFHANVSSSGPTMSLVEWTQSHLGALFPSSTADKDTKEDGDWFADAFNAAFTSDATLRLATAPKPAEGESTEASTVLNTLTPGEGDDVKEVTGDEAVDALRDFASGAPTVQFEDVTQTDGDDDSGTVVGTMLLTRNLKFRIRATPAQTLTTVRFSASISPDPHLITSYAHTSETHRKPTHFPNIHGGETDPPGGPRRSLPKQPPEPKEEL